MIGLVHHNAHCTDRLNFGSVGALECILVVMFAHCLVIKSEIIIFLLWGNTMLCVNRRQCFSCEMCGKTKFPLA